MTVPVFPRYTGIWEGTLDFWLWFFCLFWLVGFGLFLFFFLCGSFFGFVWGLFFFSPESRWCQSVKTHQRGQSRLVGSCQSLMNMSSFPAWDKGALCCLLFIRTPWCFSSDSGEDHFWATKILSVVSYLLFYLKSQVIGFGFLSP